MDCRFRILDAVVDSTGPPEVVGPIVSAYERFATDSASDRDVAIVSVASGNGGGIRADGRTVPLIEGLDATLQVYQQFLVTALDRVGSHAVLHAAALACPSGGACLLAAPAGHGKTTLTLELIHRGFRFLSDDYAPLDPTTGEISPYPRAVGVRPETTALLPEAAREAATDPSSPRLLGKTLIDVGRVFGDRAVEKRPVPLRYVFLLTSGSPDDETSFATSWLEVAAQQRAAGRIGRELEEIDGVEIMARRELPGLYLWRLELNHDRNPTPSLSRVLEDPAIIFTEKFWDDRPAPRVSPRAAPVKRRLAATLLAREQLNRRGGSRWLARYGGDVTRMYLDLAEALRDASCRCMAVGSHKETADLIETLVARED